MTLSIEDKEEEANRNALETTQEQINKIAYHNINT